ncbi:High-affinity branched-chain amino acid transport system permease protein LivH [Geobacillus sp. BCO2]|nr:High-affinity branched-chain amino acid transport system permease protein LivH [Geobacillus sp. BCO2]
MEAWSQFVQLLFSGLTVGSIYALVALGFVITYSVTGILNLAQGDFAMLGALLCMTFVNSGMPFVLAIGLSIAAVMAVGALFERLAIQPARRSSVAVLIIITIGRRLYSEGSPCLLGGRTHTRCALLRAMGRLRCLERSSNGKVSGRLSFRSRVLPPCICSFNGRTSARRWRPASSTVCRSIDGH